MRIRRLPVRDALMVDGQAVVLLSGRVFALSPTASCGWGLLTDDWTPVDEWFDAVVAQVGTPPDPASARADLVTGLVDCGCAEVSR